MITTILVLLGTLLTTTATVEVEKLDGSQTAGVLRNLSADKVTLDTEQGVTEVAFEEIIQVVPAEISDAPSETAAAEVHLADGTRLLVTDVQISSRTSMLHLIGGQQARVGKSGLLAIRFSGEPKDDAPPKDPFAARWQELVQQHAGSDAIVIARDDSLTVQEVVIHGVTEEGVRIQLDDITTTVDPTKLYGLLFYQRGSREFPAPKCEVHLDDGSRLVARSLSLNETNLQITTSIGAELVVPLNRVNKLDFAAGNIQFLDELRPTRSTWTPALPSAMTVADLALIYAPRINESFEGEPLQLEVDGLPQTFARGIAVHATSELLYDLPPGFRQLQMTVGVAPRSLPTCSVKLQIVGDQQILFEKLFSGESEPEAIALNIANVRRLKIIVDAYDGEDFGDILHFCQARLLK